MALINCSKCKSRISDTALTCVSCGNPITSDSSSNQTNPQKTWLKSKSFIVLGLIGAITFVVLAIIYTLPNNEEIFTDSTNNSSDLVSSVKIKTGVIVEPVDSNDYYSRGLELYVLKDYSGSIREFTKALESGQNLVGPYVQRARAKSALGDNTGGVLDLDKAILIDPDDVYKYKLRGDAHYRLGQWTLALQDYTMGIELSPRDKLLYHWRGWAYRNMGDEHHKLHKWKERNELHLLSCQDWRFAGDMGYEPSLTTIIKYCQ